MSLDRSKASIRINQNTRDGKNHLKLESIVRKSQSQVFENQSPYSKSSQDWDKVRYRIITQRKQEPGIKTKQTRMKGKRVRNKIQPNGTAGCQEQLVELPDTSAIRGN